MAKKKPTFSEKKLLKGRKMNLGKKWTHISLLSRNEVTGLLARQEARKAGKLAAKKIAKARQAEKNQMPMKYAAKMDNAHAQKIGREIHVAKIERKMKINSLPTREKNKVTGQTKKSTWNNPDSWRTKNHVRIAVEKQHARGEIITKGGQSTKDLERIRGTFADRSKAFARSSGGYGSTAVRARNAAKFNIEKGKYLKNKALSHGIYGIAATWLAGEMLKKKRG